MWAKGYERVAGLDEAGRGAWAGPVVAAAVVLPPDTPELLETLGSARDSKLLTSRQRDVCYQLVRRVALSCAVGAVPSDGIDRIGIVAATRGAMCEALDLICPSPDYLLIDALLLPQLATPQVAFPKGDRDCLSIAAASIMAKVTRDRWMIALDKRLPGYGFARHKGYGTPRHRAALNLRGPSFLHRHSYAPIRALDEALDVRS